MTTPSDPLALLRSRSYAVLLVLAAIVGVLVSAAAYFFLALVSKLQPDILLLGLATSGPIPLEALEGITAGGASVRTILLTGSVNTFEVMTAGIEGVPEAIRILKLRGIDGGREVATLVCRVLLADPPGKLVWNAEREGRAQAARHDAWAVRAGRTAIRIALRPE